LFSAFFICILLGVTICRTGIYFYRNLALWLFLSDPLPYSLNYICSFAGSDERETYALELLEKYTDSKLIINTNRNSFRQWAALNGFDTSRIIITPKCNSTREEILCFRNIIYQIEKDSISKKEPLIGFVSSPYHMRRISILFYFFKTRYFSKGAFCQYHFKDTSLQRKFLKSGGKKISSSSLSGQNF